MTISIAERAKPLQVFDSLLLSACVLICVGVFCRLYHPENLVLSDDEVITVMHVLGLNESELVERSADFRTVSDLRAVLHPSSQLRPYWATINALQSEDPQHPPAYYLVARAWVSVFDSSRQSLRTLSALVGIIALPCMFWLCMELFRSDRFAWVGTALLAVSPVNVLYSHEIREYGLWVVALLVSSALFLRAIRRSKLGDWVLYAFTLGLSLYVFPASIFVAFAHAMFAISSQRCWRSRIHAVVAITAACVLFTPWLVVILNSEDQISKGMNVIIHAGTTPLDVLKNVTSLLTVNNLDLDINFYGRKFLKLFIIVVVCYSVVTIKSRKDNSWRFVWFLGVCSALPFVLPDLIWTGARSSQVRYFLPFFIALDLALAALICTKCFGDQSIGLARRVWQAGFALIIAARICSCFASLESTTWWTKYSIRSVEVAKVVNSTAEPLLVSDDYLVWSLALAEYLDPTTAVAISPSCYLCTQRYHPLPDLTVLANAARPVFLLGTSDSLQAQVNAAIADKPDPTVRTIRIFEGSANDLKLHY